MSTVFVVSCVATVATLWATFDLGVLPRRVGVRGSGHITFGPFGEIVEHTTVDLVNLNEEGSATAVRFLASWAKYAVVGSSVALMCRIAPK